MKNGLIAVLAVILVAGVSPGAWRLARGLPPPAASPAVSEAAADRMVKKLEQIETNAKTRFHRGMLTTLSEEEVNSYFQYRMGKRIPPGVTEIRFTFHRDRVTGNCIADFEKVKAAQRRPVNPIVDQLLAGVKPVSAAGQFTSANGSGLFHLEEVSVGSIGLSGWLLDLVIKYFVLPRYPQAAIDRPFELGYNIEQVVLEEHRVIVRQK